MSKKDTKAERRATAREARLEAQRKRQRARRRRQLMIWGALGLAVLAIAGFVIFRQVREGASVAEAAVEAGCSNIQESQEEGRNHIEQGADHAPYKTNPPTSGPHFGDTAEWGTYPDRVEDELLLHNLEHGGVVVHYKDLDDSQIEELEDLVESYSSGVILNPNPDIDDTIAMTSWQHLRTCERASTTVIKGFIKERCGKGPEKVQLGC